MIMMIPMMSDVLQEKEVGNDHTDNARLFEIVEMSQVIECERDFGLLVSKSQSYSTKVRVSREIVLNATTCLVQI